MRKPESYLCLLPLLLLLAGCNEGKRRADGVESQAQLPPAGVLAAVPLGDLAGAAESPVRGELHNPFGDEPAAVREGENYFHGMNCVSCHGYGAKGGMGPSLADSAWRYGGTPAEIYKSIAEGRPKGMPAWAAALPPEVIWKLVAYIQSLGGAQSPEQVLASIEGWAAEAPKGRRRDESY